MTAPLVLSASGLAVAALTAAVSAIALASPVSAAPPWSEPAAVDAPPAPRTEANTVAQAQLGPRVSIG